MTVRREQEELAMAGKLGRALQMVAVITLGIIPWAVAGAQSADTLEGQIAAQYKVTKLGADSSGLTVIQEGTVLTIKKGGILSVPQADAGAPLANTVKDGDVQSPGAALVKTKKDTKFLPVGEKVYVSKLDVNRKESKVTLSIVECDTCNGAAAPSFRKAQVVFVYPKGYLDGADSGQVSDVINQVLASDGDGGGQQQAQAAPAAAAPAAADPAPATQGAAPPAAAPAGKKRVAVMNFDYGTVRSYVSAIFGSDQDVGKGISDLLVTKLVQDGKYSVIERNALDKILSEQNFSNSDRADATTAAKIGKVLGVDAIIIGSITQFGRDDQHTNVGGGGYGLGRFGLGGVGTSKAKAVVGISTRMINTTTGEILVAVNGTGESTRSSTSLLGAGGGWSGGGGGGLDMGSSNFANTILGEAVKKAVDDTGTQLDASVDKIPTIKLVINGVVADVSGNTLIINVGKRSGVRVGDKFEVSRPVRVVKDPATGKVIKSVTNKVGDATVTDVDDDSSTATLAGGPAKVGDMVKTP
jgi:curli biogenesis system outer membrane secretion channel CsgG